MNQTKQRSLRLRSKTTRQNLVTVSLVVAAYIVMQILDSNGVLSHSLSGQLVPICAYIVMTLSLNLTVGILGELSLGHAGFMSIGAFSGVIAAASLSDRISAGLSFAHYSCWHVGCVSIFLLLPVRL